MAVEDVAATDTSLDSAFESLYPPDNSGAPPSLEESPAESAPAPEGSADPAEAAQDAEAAAGEETQEEAPAAELPEDTEIAPIDTTGKKAIQIDTPRFNRIYQGYKAFQALQQFAPSVEAAKAQFEGANDYRAMHSDFRSADPESIDPFLDHWAEESPEGFAVMADRLPEKLQAVAPQAFEALQTRMLAQKVEQLYQEAAESGDKNDLYHAQLLDFKLSGKYRQAGEIQKPDPVAAREAELSKREQNLEKQETARHVAQWNGVSGRIDQAKTEGLNAEVDRVLAPAKAMYEEQPDLFGALRDRIVAKVEATLKGDFEWTRNHNIDARSIRQAFDKAVKSGAKTSGLNVEIQAYVDSYAAKVRQIVGTVARPLVSQATAGRIAASDAAHARLAKSQDRRGVSGGAGAKKSFAPALPANASFDEKFEATFAKR